MTMVINQLINGLILSGPILLVAMSLTAVVASSKIMNLSVGSAYALVALFAIRNEDTLGVAGVVLVCLLAPVLLFLLMDMLLLSHQRKRASDVHLASFASTLGVSSVFAAIAGMISGGQVLSLHPDTIYLDKSWRFGGIIIPQNGALVAAVAAAVAILFGLLIYRTGIGMQFRAIAADPFLARTAGIRPEFVMRISWISSGLLMGTAVLLMMITDRSVSTSSGDLLLALPFAAVIVGGMGSIPGAVIAAIVFGVLQSMTSVFASNSGGIQSVVVFGLLFAMLAFRPQGLRPGTVSVRAY